MTDTEAAVQAAIHSAAKQIFANYRHFIEYDDLTQELNTWVLVHATKIADWQKHDAELVAEGEVVRSPWERKLNLALRREAGRYARREKAQRTGFAVEDEYFYSRRLVRDLLPAVLGGGRDGFEREGPKGAVRAPSDPAEGNNQAALLADVAAAWAAHPDQLLAERYWPGAVKLSVEDMALRHGLSVPAYNRRERRALDRLVDFLGGVDPNE